MSHPSIVIYHHPRCSKSRSACALVAERGLNAEIVDTLATPPSRETLQVLLGKLGITASELVRRGEEIFKTEYAGKTLSEAQWLDALCQHPILIERPIVVVGDRAVIGRPPEKVLALIDEAV